jgi:hypothetical protein
MLKLDENGRFDSGGKKLGVVATQKGKRWQFRDAATNNLIASGMTPAQFAKDFWYREDFTERGTE